MGFLASIFLLILATGSVQATTVHVVATGTLVEYSDPLGLLQMTQPTTGSAFTLTFSYDDTKPDLASSDPNVGIYPNAVSGMTLTVAGIPLPALHPERAGSIVIPYNHEDHDLWIATSGRWISGPGGEMLTESFQLGLVGPTGILQSDALVPPPWPASWQSAHIHYFIRQEVLEGDWITWATASASIESITAVPLPTGIWLIANGVGLLGWRAYRTFQRGPQI